MKQSPNAEYFVNEYCFSEWKKSASLSKADFYNPKQFSDINTLSEKKLQIGDKIFFGKKSRMALAWKVLKKLDNNALIICCNNIGFKPYHVHREKITWNDCTLRKWLNSSFLEEYFTSSEYARILNSNVPNEDNPRYKTPGGETTIDKAFLLSIKEAKLLLTDAELRSKSFGWLRSPGESPICAAYINNGLISVNGTYVTHDNYVFPVLWINMCGLEAIEEYEIIQ